MKWLRVALSVSLILGVSVEAAQAASSPSGRPCKKIGSTQVYQGKKFTCIRSGKKVVWNKGVTSGNKIPAQGASSAPSATATRISTSWQWDDQSQKWVSSGTAPACTFPLIPDGSFVDFASAIAKSQPGQSRGGSYKPHGTIRWSNSSQAYKENVIVAMPFDATVTSVWHYLVGGVYQFGFNAINPCGVMLRVGHLHTPSALFNQILSALAPAVENDSREYPVDAAVKKGDQIATAVGIPTGTPSEVGAFLDFAIVDLRNMNPKLPASFTSNADPKYSKYAVCWYEDNWLGPHDRSLAGALPYADGNSASDYCQKS